ncbi:MAG: hypothetical protein Q7S73_01255 [bacterium]|jgi:hypothetical protein|nr:hypothetical protein [bacterium]
MFKFLANLFFISFLLNFVWEISQMVFYSELGMGIRNNYIEFLKIHWAVSLKDALMIMSAYLIIGFLIRNCLPTGDVPKEQDWSKSFNLGWVMLWLLLPLWQAVIEYYSVYLYHRWAYAPAMPLIFGIGLLPILQMLILPSAAILLSKKHEIRS